MAAETSTSGLEHQQLSAGRRLFIIVAAVALVLGLFVVAGGAAFLWYLSRSHRPKAWDTSAITATYQRFGTQGDPPQFTFFYTLQNNTELDYRVENAADLETLADLENSRTLSQPAPTVLYVETPIFIPAQHRQRVVIHLNYRAPASEPSLDASAEEHATFREETRKVLRDKFANLKGFRIFDKKTRYEIILPASW